ncbi:MAG: hypothetical protein RSB70_05780 [Clostridium sp.]
MNENSEILYLIWRISDDEYIKIGELRRTFGERYYFKYDIEGVKMATREGFKVFNTMPVVTASYFKEELFSVFIKRVSGKYKKEIMECKNVDNIKEYDEFELLKISRGRIKEDKVEFLSSISGVGL